MSAAAPEKAPMTRAQKVLERTRVGGTLAVCVAALLWAASTSVGGYVVLAAATVIAAWCVVEAARMGLFSSRLGPTGALVVVSTVALAMGFGGGALVSPHEPGWLLLKVLGVALPGVAIAYFGGPADPRTAPDGTQRVGVGLPPVVMVPLIALPPFFLYPLWALGGVGALAAFVGLAKIGDIAGYYAGNALGKHHPFPKLSPGKTTEGCLASLIAGTAVGGVLAHFGAFGEARFGLASGLVLGALVNVTAQSGDLFESWLKRRSGVKDSGTTFGPSGGMLDLVDSFLFAAPLAATIGPFLFHWPGTQIV